MGKIFGTDGIRCLVNEEPLSAETTLKISKTVGYLLKSTKKINSRVIICKDTRLSGYLYEPLITAGFISMGMEVILVGPLPTPAVPHLMKTLRADIGVMITASHNTYEYNGLKFFNSDGYKISTLLEKKIENIVLNKNKYAKIINSNSNTGKAIRLEDASGRYSEFLKSTLDKKIKLEKLKIVLDCGNGATYEIAPNIFRELGHEVLSINDEPNGKNINYNCGAVNTNSLSKKVLDLGGQISLNSKVCEINTEEQKVTFLKDNREVNSHFDFLFSTIPIKPLSSIIVPQAPAEVVTSFNNLKTWLV